MEGALQKEYFSILGVRKASQRKQHVNFNLLMPLKTVVTSSRERAIILISESTIATTNHCL